HRARRRDASGGDREQLESIVGGVDREEPRAVRRQGKRPYLPALEVDEALRSGRERAGEREGQRKTGPGGANHCGAGNIQIARASRENWPKRPKRRPKCQRGADAHAVRVRSSDIQPLLEEELAMAARGLVRGPDQKITVRPVETRGLELVRVEDDGPAAA